MQPAPREPEEDQRPIRRVCVFCGSQPGNSPAYLEAARDVGSALARRGWGLVYGGARVGTMGALADAALEAGVSVYGVIPARLSQREVAHPNLDELFIVDSMHARKAMMAHLSDAFCVLPGGFGTLDESFEALTWNQLGYHRKPLAFYGPPGFWNHLLAFADHAVQEGFLRAEHRAMMFAGTDIETVMDYLAEAKLPTVPKWMDRP